LTLLFQFSQQLSNDAVNLKVN